MSPARVRLTTILAIAVVAALALLAWSQSWATARLTDGATVTASGDDAAAALSALGLADLALAVALALAGPVIRVVLGALQIALGACIVLSAALVLGDPLASLAPAVTAHTGIAASSARGLVRSVALTPWPAVALVAGVLAILLGAALLATRRRWPAQSRRHSAVRLAPARPGDAVAEWDALTGGLDPTDDDADGPADPSRSEGGR